MAAYLLQQSDMDVFGAIKARHPELEVNNVDVLPVANGTTNFSTSPPTFIPDGTYTLSDTDFASAAMGFYDDLTEQGFFNNLQKQ
ncbi:MAG: hypothetical protein HKL88_06910 [Bacteroidia bacterium]|nr:hypothetical protein [Bacteroidia bacterium]